LAVCGALSLASRPHRRPLAFPTRRSSDLHDPQMGIGPQGQPPTGMRLDEGVGGNTEAFLDLNTMMADLALLDGRIGPDFLVDFRSEEHTSELQSRENLVCRLLLEKKKNRQ